MNIEEAQDKLQVALEGMVQDLFSGDDYAGTRQQLDEAWALIREAIRPTPDKSIDLGELCTHCGRDTAWGSDLFINRIPSDTDATLELQGIDPELYPGVSNPEAKIGVNVSGYMCIECLAQDCDDCGGLIPGDEDVYLDGIDKRVCAACAETLYACQILERGGP